MLEHSSKAIIENGIMKKLAPLQTYRNSRLSTEKRGKELRKGITLEEESAQMMGMWQEQIIKLVNAQGSCEQGDL